MDTKEFFERFLSTEARFGLFERQFRGIRYWGMLRYSVFPELELLVGLVTSGVEWPGNASLREGAVKKGVKSLLASAGKHNPLYAKKADILFSYAPRKVQSDRGYIDGMIDIIADNLKDTFCILERSPKFEHIPYELERTVYYHDPYDYARVARSYLRKANKKWQQEARAEVQRLQAEFFETFGVLLPVQKLADRLIYAVTSAEVLSGAYRKLLERISPKAVVMVCFYDIPNLCMSRVAHELKIPTIDLQHGLLTPGVIQYSFPPMCADEEWLPDRVFCFGQFAVDSSDFPDKAHRMIPTGFPLFEQQAAVVKERRNVTQGRDILVVSSTPLADQMIEFSIRLAELLPPEAGQVVYKLHPNDCKGWRERYPQLAACKAIRVEDDPARSIYESFATARCQIGTFSTALFEGVGCGIPTILLKIGIYTIATALCNCGAAVLTDSPEEAAERIANETLPVVSEEMIAPFWKSDSVRTIVSALHEFVGEGSKATEHEMNT